jgi:hypothetical protein
MAYVIVYNQAYVQKNVQKQSEKHEKSILLKREKKHFKIS